MAVTFDEVSGQYIPQSGSEWTELLSGTGLSNPDGLYLCQEASGNLADTLGGIGTLTKFSGPAYQQPVRGWKRKGVGMVGDSNAAFYTTAHGDIDTESFLILAYVGFPTTPAATWNVMQVGQFAGANQRHAQITSGGAMQAAGGGGQATATGNVNLTATGHGGPGRSARAVLLQVDRANSAFVVHHDVETVSPAWTAPAAGTAGISIGPDGNGASDAVYLYVAIWKGSAAEMTATQRKLLLRRLQQGPAIADGNWYVDQLSKKGMPQTSGEWDDLLSSIGQSGSPAHVYTFQEQAQSSILISDPQDQIGTKHLTASGTLGARREMPGWATRAARTARGGAGRAINTTFANINANSILVIFYARVLYVGASGVDRTLMRIGDVFDQDCALEMRTTPDPKMRLTSHSNDADGTVVTQKFVRAHAVRINQTANTVKYFTDRGKETLSPTFSASMAGTELCFGGDNNQTWYPGTVDYVYAAVFTGANAEKSDADIAEILEALNWKDDAVTQDATSGWYTPKDAYEWESLLSGTGVPTPTHLYSLQEETGDYVNQIGYESEADNDDVLASIVGGTRGASVTGWTRKGWSVTDNNSHSLNGANSLAAQAAFVGFMTGSIANPAAQRTISYINGLKMNIEPTVDNHIGMSNNNTVSALISNNTAENKNLLGMHWTPAGGGSARADGYTQNERIRAGHAAIDTSGIYLGGVVQTTVAMGYVYLFAYARTLGDPTTKQIAMLFDCLRYGPANTRSLAAFTDAASGRKFPRGPGDWFKLLEGSGIEVPNGIYECQELSGNLSDRGLQAVLEESNGPAFNQAVTGFTRKAVGLTAATANHGFTSTSTQLADPATVSTFFLGIGKLTATPAAIQGVLCSSEHGQLRLTSGDKLRVINSSNSADGAIDRDSTVRPFWHQQDETANDTNGGDDQATISPTYAAMSGGRRIALGGFDAAACAAQWLYAAYWEGSGAEMSSGEIADLFELLEPSGVTHQRSAALDGATTVDVVAQAVITGFGGAGAATFTLHVEGGGSVKYQWGTDILPQRGDGKERRMSWRARPRVGYKFSALLSDPSVRDVRGLLLESAPQASTFLVGLPYEGLFLRADSSGVTVPVFSGAKALCDWAIHRQRVIVRAPDGTISEGIINTSTADTIVLDVAPGAAGKVNGIIMPAMEIYLDGTQGFDRFAQKRERWELNAIGLQPGFVGSIGTIGTGASLTTILGIDGSTIPIFDRGVIVSPTSNNSIIPTAQRIDLGYLVTMVSVQAAAQFGRQVAYKRASRAEWQWLKKFLFNVRGRNKRFLLPTGRPDLVATALDGEVGLTNATLNTNTMTNLVLDTGGNPKWNAVIRWDVAGTVGNGKLLKVTVRNGPPGPATFEVRDNEAWNGSSWVSEAGTVGVLIDADGFDPGYGMDDLEAAINAQSALCTVITPDSTNPNVPFVQPQSGQGTFAGGTDAFTEIIVDAAPQYAERWFALSTAHRHLAIRYKNGSIDYRRIDDADNEGATDRITLANSIVGPFANIDMISIMELCRFDSDDMEIVWNGPTFSFGSVARVVLQ